MTNDLETSPDLFENDEQENLSELSLSSASEMKSPEAEEEDLPNSTLPTELSELLHIDDNPKEEQDDLTQFINKAREQDFNCLDLSKKNIAEFPLTLLEFPSLQVISLSRSNLLHPHSRLVFVFRRESNQSITR